ncbi:MAG: PhzF family phenazine biosynthesis protein [Proteobacteria bacterium]|nr:PhzF family phenazine biosynthesis protein [Pseudomonadota bacterium]
MQYKYYIVDVFSRSPFGGNQLAVLPEATGISMEGMQRIAREFNFVSILVSILVTATIFPKSLQPVGI